MIYLSNVATPQEISIPRSFGAGLPVIEPGFQPIKTYLTTDDIADNLTTDSDKKILAASQGVVIAGELERLSEEMEGKADADSVYTKQEVDSELSGKADETEVARTYETKEDASAKETALETAIDLKQDKISDLDAIRSGAEAGSTAYQKPSSGIPASDIAPGVIPAAQVNSDWNAESGVAKILNKPSIPAAQVNSDWEAEEGVAKILNKPTIPDKYAGSPTAGGFANKAVAIPFGKLDADSTSTIMKASVDNFPDTLSNGVCALIKNGVVTSASGVTLNINGTGAKPIYQTLAASSAVTTAFNVNYTMLFIFNAERISGGCWDMYYGFNSNDNTIGYNLRTNSMSLPVSGACYRYRLLFTSADGTHFVPANTSSSTNATSTRATNQTPIDPFGSIRYYSYTTAISSGSRPGVTYLWEQYALVLGYSFNRTGAALVLVSWKPVYIKCAPQADGSAIIDADTPYVQALPTAADGKIYIYLGVAYNATNVEMVFHHPVYYIDGNGRKRIWTGEDISI